MSDPKALQQAESLGVVEVAFFAGPEFFRRVARLSNDGAQVRACLLHAADQLEELQATSPPLRVLQSNN
jgi:hypothetical protein